MEASTVFILIFLSTVGARNIPVRIDEPSAEYQQIFGENHQSYKTAENSVDELPIEDLGTILNILRLIINNVNIEETEQSEEVSNIADVNNDIFGVATNEKEDFISSFSRERKVTESILNHVEVMKEGKDTTGKAVKFEDRSNFNGACPPGTTRVGSECWKIQ